MRLVTVGIWYLIKPDQDEINFELKDGAVSLSYGAWLCGYRPIPGDDIKRDPDMDYIGCLGSNGQHSQILPFRVTFIVVTRYILS